MSIHESSGYAAVNGVNLYWESRGAGGTPLVMVHGGFGTTDMMEALAARLSAVRRVIAVELRGHGHTADIDRPFTWESLGEDVAALIPALGLGQADLLGYSLGAGTCLRGAIQHPEAVRRLVVVSFPFAHQGWFPGVRAGFDQLTRAALPFLQASPLYTAYARVAPAPDAFPILIDKTGELNRQPFDWSEGVRGLPVRTLLAFADADSIPPSHVAEFFGLLGGGLVDAGWDGSARPANQLAVIPGTTHYDIAASPLLGAAVDDFLKARD